MSTSSRSSGGWGGGSIDGENEGADTMGVQSSQGTIDPGENENVQVADLRELASLEKAVSLDKPHRHTRK